MFYRLRLIDPMRSVCDSLPEVCLTRGRERSKTDQSSSLPITVVGSSLSRSEAPGALARHGRSERLHREPILCFDVDCDSGPEFDGEMIIEKRLK